MAMLKNESPQNIQEQKEKERKPTLQEIAEASQWHSLFKEGWLTAHELSGLQSHDTPKTTGEIFKVETENLRKIKAIIEADESDAAFRLHMEDIRPLLPRPFSRMVGVYQTIPHEDIDPVDHTFNALWELDTTGLSEEDRLTARTTLVFHDVGKVEDPKDRNHPRRSANIARDYLVKMGYEPKQTDKILNQIKWHDALGDVSREDGRNIFNYRDVLIFFKDEAELEVHKCVSLADISSIPGLREFTDNVEETYERLLHRLRERKNGIVLTVDSDIPEVPFELVSTDQFFQIIEKLDIEEEEFDDIDIKERMSKIRAKAEVLTEEEKTVLEKTVVQQSLENSPLCLKALQIMGRETDTSLADELEKKYGVPLNELRVATNLFGLTYNMWELKWDVLKEQDEPSEENRALIKRKLEDVAKYARKLSQYEVPATHVTDEESWKEIKKIGVLFKSTGHHYEGEGVYTGILGSYTNWRESEPIKVILPLADTLPIIVDFKYPEAMANAIAEMLDTEKGTQDRAVAHGLIQWYHTDNDNMEPAPWKIRLLESALKEKAVVTTDELGLPCIVMDTKEEPIVWASLCRSLLIRRFIPQEELSKAAFGKRREGKVSEETVTLTYPYETGPVVSVRWHNVPWEEREELSKAA